MLCYRIQLAKKRAAATQPVKISFRFPIRMLCIDALDRFIERPHISNRQFIDMKMENRIKWWNKYRNQYPRLEIARRRFWTYCWRAHTSIRPKCSNFSLNCLKASRTRVQKTFRTNNKKAYLYHNKTSICSSVYCLLFLYNPCKRSLLMHYARNILQRLRNLKI